VAAGPANAAVPAQRPPAPARAFPWGIVIVVLALGLLTVVGGVAGLLWLRGRGAKKTDEAPTQVAEQTPSTVPASYPDVRPATTGPAPAPSTTIPTQTIPQQPPAPVATAPIVVPAPSRAPEPVATTKPLPTQRAEPTVRATTRPPVPDDTPRQVEPSRPAPVPPPAPPPADEEDERPTQRYDREMSSSLALKFKIEPEDAIVTFKEEGDRRFTVIGRASEFAADKKKLAPFELPGEGTYYVRIVAEGREIIFKLDASPGGPPTTIAHVLIPKLGRRRN